MFYYKLNKKIIYPYKYKSVKSYHITPYIIKLLDLREENEENFSNKIFHSLFKWWEINFYIINNLLFITYQKTTYNESIISFKLDKKYKSMKYTFHINMDHIYNTYFYLLSIGNYVLPFSITCDYLHPFFHIYDEINNEISLNVQNLLNEEKNYILSNCSSLLPIDVNFMENPYLHVYLFFYKYIKDNEKVILIDFINNPNKIETNREEILSLFNILCYSFELYEIDYIDYIINKFVSEYIKNLKEGKGEIHSLNLYNYIITKYNLYVHYPIYISFLKQQFFIQKNKLSEETIDKISEVISYYSNPYKVLKCKYNQLMGLDKDLERYYNFKKIFLKIK